MPLTIENLRAAQLRVRGRVVVTPLIESAALNALAGTRVWLKAESLQKGGAFKIRGAFNKILRLMEDGTCAGVIAYSSGNHALAVSLAAAELGVPAVVLMPRDAPAIKIDGARRNGAEVVLYDREHDDREAICAQLMRARGLLLVPPYDDHDVMAGAGTGALEAIEQLPSSAAIDTVLVCCGGGGLTSGWATAAGALLPGAQVHAIEPEGFDDTGRSLVQGARVRNRALSGTICDALLVPTPGAMAFEVMRTCRVRGATVSDSEVSAAMRFGFEHLKLVLEPGGAAALAAAMFRRFPTRASGVLAILSGGNVDAEVFERSIGHVHC